ncbi:MAG: PEP-CTERM sorting domain-containing protein [Gammaproteobacteria bacterium]
MLKKAVACALLLGAAMGGAQAADQTWTFTWTGFDYIEGGYWGHAPAVWQPEKTLSTEFSGSDLDGNGLIELGELSKLNIKTANGWWQILPCVAGGDCEAEFELGPNNLLDIHMKYRHSGEFDYYESWYHIGNTFGARYTSTGSIQWEDNFRWTPNTTLTVVAAPVPEPAEWAMFGAGAALLGGIAARRRKAAGKQAV